MYKFFLIIYQSLQVSTVSTVGSYNILCLKIFVKLVFPVTLNPLPFYAILKFD